MSTVAASRHGVCPVEPPLAVTIQAFGLMVRWRSQVGWYRLDFGQHRDGVAMVVLDGRAVYALRSARQEDLVHGFNLCLCSQPWYSPDGGPGDGCSLGGEMDTRFSRPLGYSRFAAEAQRIANTHTRSLWPLSLVGLGNLRLPGEGG